MKPTGYPLPMSVRLRGYCQRCDAVTELKVIHMLDVIDERTFVSIALRCPKCRRQATSFPKTPPKTSRTTKRGKAESGH